MKLRMAIVGIVVALLGTWAWFEWGPLDVARDIEDMFDHPDCLAVEPRLRILCTEIRCEDLIPEATSFGPTLDALESACTRHPRDRYPMEPWACGSAACRKLADLDPDRALDLVERVGLYPGDWPSGIAHNVGAGLPQLSEAGARRVALLELGDEVMGGFNRSSDVDSLLVMLATRLEAQLPLRHWDSLFWQVRYSSRDPLTALSSLLGKSTRYDDAILESIEEACQDAGANGYATRPRAGHELFEALGPPGRLPNALQAARRKKTPTCLRLRGFVDRS